MRILPTTADDMSARGQAGITLVEVLVALAITAVMSSAAVMSLGGSTRTSTENEARRLAGRLGAAADRAITHGESIALEWDERGYAFDQLEAAAKPTVTADALADRIVLGGGVHLEGPRSQGKFTVGMEGAEPVAFILTGTSGASWRVSFNGLVATAEAIDTQ